MITLHKCPFCGADAVYRFSSLENKIECESCNVQFYFPKNLSGEEVAEKWNDRKGEENRQYIIVNSHNEDIVMKRVNKLLMRGYELYGNLIVAYNGQFRYHYQAMIKRGE